MTAPVGFLDFFVLEASDYVEQLDALLLKSGAAGPDVDALQRVSRALRGSSTMAKLPAFAEIATGIERVGRALRDATLTWEPGVGGALIAAVDDCKLLLRNVRSWSPSDDARASARVDELLRYAPRRVATPLTSPAVAVHDDYLARESANIGAGLELLATRPTDNAAAVNVLRRVRALRGLAGVKDFPSLADVLEGAEAAAGPLELGQATLSVERIAVLSAAATVLRSAAQAMRAGRAANAPSPSLDAFATALVAMREGETGTARVVPITELFYEDQGVTIVERAANPPISSANRFQLDVVSQGEHLRRLVGDARLARDDTARERVRRALRQLLATLHDAAESFGETAIAQFVGMHNETVVGLSAHALDSLDELATLVAPPQGETSTMAERLAALTSARAARRIAATTEAASATEAETPADRVDASPAEPRAASVPLTVSPSPTHMMTPISAPPAHARPSSQPQDRLEPAAAAAGAVAATAPSASPSLGSLLDAGITRLSHLEHTPLRAPIQLSDQPPVSIGVLLYRGRAAIERCREIRDVVRQTSGPVDADALGELFDLLDLALTD